MVSEFHDPAAIEDQQSRQSRRRGIPSAFTDEQLWNRRDQLVQTFEAFWGRVGRELPRIKQSEDIEVILKPLQQGYISDVISVYCRPSSQPPSAKKLRKLRSELRTATEPWLDSERAKIQALDHLHVADAAIANRRTRSPMSHLLRPKTSSVNDEQTQISRDFAWQLKDRLEIYDGAEPAADSSPKSCRDAAQPHQRCIRGERVMVLVNSIVATSFPS